MEEIKDERIVKHSEYHYSILGKFYRVNFYPTKKTYYINGCNKAVNNNYPNLKFIIDLADGKIEIEKPLSKIKEKYKYKTNIKKKLFKKNASYCFVCGKALLNIKDATLEHKIPLSKGGSNRKDNLALSCKKCNSRKSNNIKLA